jgi:hypothetical protein
MSIYQDRKTYFKNLAKADPVIRHEVDGRISYYATDEETVVSGVKGSDAKAFVWYEGLQVNSADPDGAFNSIIPHTLRFYIKIEQDDTDKDLHSATERALEVAFEICEHWRRRIYTDGYNDGAGQPFDKINPSTIALSALQVFADNFIGWRLTFTETKIEIDYHIPETAYWTV